MSKDSIEKFNIIGFWVGAVALGTFGTYIIMITRYENKMVMKRIHMIELSRFYQRIENQKRKSVVQKKGLIKRLFNVR